MQPVNAEDQVAMLLGSAAELKAKIGKTRLAETMQEHAQAEHA